MKKVSLIIACIGIFSTAIVAQKKNNIQEGKVKKAEHIQTAPVQKTQKEESIQPLAGQSAEPTIQKSETRQKTQSTPVAPRKRTVAPAQRPVKKLAVAPEVIKATPAQVGEEKR